MKRGRGGGRSESQFLGSLVQQLRSAEESANARKLVFTSSDGAVLLEQNGRGLLTHVTINPTLEGNTEAIEKAVLDAASLMTPPLQDDNTEGLEEAISDVFDQALGTKNKKKKS